ncbi:MAG: SDR family oxidoreductase [Theionarchaea archaeon]|nr:SDR family oxidoreductase [Theionarchaea archaeon]
MNAPDRPRALITGASSGIGAAFAKKLAQKGFNLILHGRREGKLTELAENLKRYNIFTEILIAELSRAEEQRRIETRIQALDSLDMLINNAGYWTPGMFWETSPDSLEAMIMVHVIAPVRFIRAALPRMLERNKGDIINVSSMGAYFNFFTVENYGATKAYLANLTESLHVALMGTGLRVQVLAPGFTLTDFHSRLGADFSKAQQKWMLPEEVVDISLKGLEKGQVVCIPGFKRQFLVKCAHMLPRAIYYRVMQKVGMRAKKNWEKATE